MHMHAVSVILSARATLCLEVYAGTETVKHRGQVFSWGCYKKGAVACEKYGTLVFTKTCSTAETPCPSGTLNKTNFRPHIVPREGLRCRCPN